MRRLIAAVVAAALMLTVAAGPAAGSRNTSIVAPDGLHYGDTFVPVSWTGPNHLGPNDFLFASAFCAADSGGGWAQTMFLDGPYVVIGNPAPLGPIGETPSWNTLLPGFLPSADCMLSLVLFNPYHGGDTYLATDSFRVAP